MKFDGGHFLSYDVRPSLAVILYLPDAYMHTHFT